MLSIRLRRMGKKKQPVYRIIVLDKRKDPWGDYLENLGTYNPRTNPSTIVLKTNRIKYWLGVGAKPSPTIHNIFVDEKIINEEKIKATSTKKKDEKKKGDKTEEEPSTNKETSKDTKEQEDKPKEDADSEKKEEVKTEEKPKEEETKTEEKDK